MADDTRLVDVVELAGYLGVPGKTLYAWRYRRKGPAALRLAVTFGIGGVTLIDGSQISWTNQMGRTDKHGPHTSNRRRPMAGSLPGSKRAGEHETSHGKPTPNDSSSGSNPTSCEGIGLTPRPV